MASVKAPPITQPTFMMRRRGSLKERKRSVTICSPLSGIAPRAPKFSPVKHFFGCPRSTMTFLSRMYLTASSM